MPTLSYTDLGQNLAAVLDDVVESRTPVTITGQKGRRNVVILSEEEFAEWQETVHLLASPANVTRLIGSLRSALCGNVQERDLAPAAANPEPSKSALRSRGKITFSEPAMIETPIGKPTTWSVSNRARRQARPGRLKFL